ncbi:MAG: uracil-DNA glycosylase [Cytophagales bacterium]|nr:uracil-DNA glycosylase [Cytophagales bacterium]
MEFPEGTWKRLLSGEFGKDYYLKLGEFVDREYAEETVYPPRPLLFNAFAKCPFEETKVVIIGQDPYHGKGQANGLCFSVNEGVKFPPSLKNIFKEVESQTGNPVPLFGSLERWAAQGVLLLNAILTVREKQAGSHQKKGWEEFTDAVIRKLSEDRKGLVFILWGAYAQKKGSVIDRERHLVLESVHPSPLSAHRGFFGNKHFVKANEYLKSEGMSPVEW